jgi:hypothetical protein
MARYSRIVGRTSNSGSKVREFESRNKIAERQIKEINIKLMHQTQKTGPVFKNKNKINKKLTLDLYEMSI